MRIALILDPLASLKPYKDTSLAIMREAASRGHELFVSMQGDLFLKHDQVRLNALSFQFTEGHHWYALGEYSEHSPKDFDVVLMRKDPPFDNEFLYSTYLLDLAEQQGARVDAGDAHIERGLLAISQPSALDAGGRRVRGGTTAAADQGGGEGGGQKEGQALLHK